LRVDYQCGMRRFSEYVCLEHEGFARRKAEQWWRRLVGPGDVPTSAVAAAAWLAERPLRVRQIEVQPDGKYERVTAHVKNEGGCDG
jgi:DNA repair protein RadD